MRTNELEKRYLDKRIFTGIFSSFLLLAVLVAIQVAMVGAQPVQPVEKQIEVEKAVLAEDWAKAAELLELVDATDTTTSPVLRLIKGHACLALNRNNESLCLFLSVSSENELKEWEEWTRGFVKKHSQKAIACYFEGDALARLKRWDEALGAFNNALNLKPNHGMVLNARGVVYAAKEQLEKASLDFMGAIKSNPSFADAYANCGARNIQKKDGPEGALRWFNQALEISPGFALALHGRGCVKLVINDYDFEESDEAEKDFESALKHGSNLAGLFLENLLNVQACISGATKEELYAMHFTEPGTTFDVSFKDVEDAWKKYTGHVDRSRGGFIDNQFQRHYYRRFDEKFGTLSAFQQEKFFGGVMASDLGGSDKLKGNYQKDLGISGNYHHGGYADKHTNLTQKAFEGMIVSGAFVKEPVSIATGITGRMSMEFLKQWTAQTGKGEKTQMECFNRHFGGTKASEGGVKADFRGVFFEEGEWPFVEYYGLLYQVKTLDIPLKPMAEGKGDVE